MYMHVYVKVHILRLRCPNNFVSHCVCSKVNDDPEEEEHLFVSIFSPYDSSSVSLFVRVS